MNLKQAARRLGVHYQTAYNWVRSGALPAVKQAWGYELSEHAVDEFARTRGMTIADPPARRETPDLSELVALAGRTVFDASECLQAAARTWADHVDLTSIGRRDGDMVVAIAGHSHDARLFNRYSTVVNESGIVVPIEMEPWRTVFEDGNVGILDHFPQRQFEGYLGADGLSLLDGRRVYSWMGAPISDGVEVVAIISGGNVRPDVPLTDDLTPILSAIAAICSAAVTRVRVIEEMVATADRVRRSVVEVRDGDASRDGAPDIAAVLDDGHAQAVFAADGAVVAETELAMVDPTRTEWAPWVLQLMESSSDTESVMDRADDGAWTSLRTATVIRGHGQHPTYALVTSVVAEPVPDGSELADDSADGGPGG